MSSGGYSLAAVLGLLTAAASLVAEPGLRGPQASGVVARGVAHGVRDLPGAEVKPVSPVLAGEFATSGPPGKHLLVLHYKKLPASRENRSQA